MKRQPGYRLDSIFFALEAMMNSDQIKGRAKTVKGKGEEIAGKILSDKVMEKKGTILKETGKVQSAYGDLKNDLKKK
jgi:uncharacterized protein YjbJ (UPF0337 family)